MSKVAQWQRLLTHPKISDVAPLVKLLNNPKVQDGMQLEMLLGQAKLASGRQLQTLLVHAKVTSGTQLNTLLSLSKLDSGARLLAFLNDGKVANGAQLVTLLSDVKVADSSELASLLIEAKISSAAELIQLMARAPSAAQVRRLLTIHPNGNALLAYLSLNVTQRLETVLTSGEAVYFSPPNLALVTAEWVTLGVSDGISGPQALLNLINRRWAISDIRAVLTQAHMANGPDNNEMTRLLAWAALYNWPFAQVNPFIAHVIPTVASGNVNPAPPWTTVLNWVDTFRQHHVGPPGPMPPQFILHTTDYPAPPSYRVLAYRRPTNMNHYYRGHSFEHFSFTDRNINRVRFTSFWPLGTDWATIQAKIDIRAGKPAAIADANHARWPPRTQSSNINDFRVGFRFWQTHFDAALGCHVYDVQLNQFFPEPALTHLTIHQNILKGIKTLLRK